MGGTFRFPNRIVDATAPMRVTAGPSLF